MDNKKYKHKLVAKRHRDRKKEYIKKLEKENEEMKIIIKSMGLQLIGINKFTSRALFLPTPSFLEKKNN